MRELPDLLGQTALADRLVAGLTAPASRLWLKGPSGSGKTTTIGVVAERLKKTCQVIRFAGDVAHAGSKFFSAHQALDGKRLRKPVREAMQGGITAPLKAIPFVGSAAADLARIAVGSLGAAKPEFLSAEQQDILQGLQSFAGHGHLVIIIDDVGWLDSDTAQLLLWLTRPELHKAFPFAQQASILFVETSDIPALLPQSLLDKLRPSRIETPLAVDRDRFGAVLEAFGLKRRLDAQLLDDLFAIAQGHLEIAKQIVKLDQGADLASLLTRDNAAELMSELLASRLQRLDGEAALRRLLSIAACAGSAFSEAEVRCAFMDPEVFTSALEAARRENLLTDDGDLLRFAHEVIRAAAAALSSPQAAELHRKLAACVKKLRPGDYSGRLRHARLSDDLADLNTLAFAIAMQGVRGERLLSTSCEEIGPLEAVFSDLREGYRLMDVGAHRQAIDLVMLHYTGEAGMVQGEVVALLALNQLKLRTMDAYNAAGSLLEVWSVRRDEPEIWQRLMSVLVTALSFAGETERASQLYSVLARDLERTSRADPMARSRLEALNRKADMFFTSEIAAKHIARAAEWFGPDHEGGSPRHGFEYTASLVNLSGALFTCGRFASAAELAAKALHSAAALGQVGLRSVEPYKALNNYIVAALRGGLEAPATLGAALDVFMGGSAKDHLRDRSLIASNRAALALLAGDLEAGRSQLEAIWRHVEDAGLDDYYRLYVGTNLVAARAMTGARAEAGALLDLVGADLGAVPKWFKTAHRRRHDLARRAIDDPAVASIADWDAYPSRVRAPDGDNDPWRSIGHGLLLSDIQVWSEG